jgi:hypothetical protein
METTELIEALLKLLPLAEGVIDLANKVKANDPAAWATAQAQYAAGKQAWDDAGKAQR